jgi:hypothetical protein
MIVIKVIQKLPIPRRKDLMKHIVRSIEERNKIEKTAETKIKKLESLENLKLTDDAKEINAEIGELAQKFSVLDRQETLLLGLATQGNRKFRYN